MTAWQPIETAPEEGVFLVFGHWDGDERAVIALPDYTYRETDGRFRFVRDGEPVEFDYGTATHWMPLPEPPEPSK